MDYDTWKTGGAYAYDCDGCGRRLTELDAHYGCEPCADWESDAERAARQFFADVWAGDTTNYWGREPGQDDPADYFDTLTEDDFEVGASWGFRAEFPDPEDAAVAWISRRLIWGEDDEQAMLAVAVRGRR